MHFLGRDSLNLDLWDNRSMGFHLTSRLQIQRGMESTYFEDSGKLEAIYPLLFQYTHSTTLPPSS